MLPRHPSDYRTLVWAFVLFPAVAFAPYVDPRLIGWLLPLGLYMGFCAGVFSHNQNHCPTFRSVRMNGFYSAWLSVFYGYPTFAWIPTHNLNHHKFLNKAGDATITWRYSKNHNWTIASTYFFVSAYWQSDPIKGYIAKAKATNPALFRRVVAQYVIVFGTHAALLALAVALHGVRTGLLAYASGFLVPALFALWVMMFVNYIQHVHCDPWSPHDHSRNFVSKLTNFWVFNNGYHAAHHEQAGAHWSALPALHAKIEPYIDGALLERTMFGFCFRVYVLGLFSAKFRTRQVGRAPFDPPGGGRIDLTIGEVEAAEQGTNALPA